MRILLKSFLLSTFLLVAFDCAFAVSSPSITTSKPKVEVAFVLDTTGSMGGLIAAAKEKIWAIANTLTQARPAPEIRMALIGYRDRGDAYVTRVTDLTKNIDSLYETLMGFQAGGGGDGPESVNQALSEAVSKLSWSSDSDTYRVIFLVGDAPPHMDYQDDTKYPQTVKAAMTKGIFVNTIQCGALPETTPIWQEIARYGEGQFFQVAQGGSAIVVPSPYDAELAKLSSEVDATRLPYGTAAEQASQSSRFDVASKFRASAPATAMAGRSVLNAGASGESNWLGEKELLHDVEGGKVSLDKLKSDELPEALRNVAPEKREALVKEKIETRTKLQAKIRELADKRQEYLAKEVKKSGSDKGSLDYGLYSAIKEQAAKKNIEYDKGPAF